MAGVLVLLATFTPVLKWSVQCLARPWDAADGDVLILLSGTTIGRDEAPDTAIVGENTYWRTIHALYLWRHGHYRYLVVSGLDSAAAIKPLLVAYGVPGSAIVVENRAQSTRENALFLKPLLARLGGRLVLTTSDYHTYRATRCFRKVGIAVLTQPAPDLGKPSRSLADRWPGLWSVLVELAKIVYYRAQGWI